MVKFEKDGQGFFEFLELNCGQEFINIVKSGLSNDNFNSNEVIQFKKNGENIVEVIISHQNEWFSILTQIKNPDNTFLCISDKFHQHHINVISKYLAGDKND